MSSSRVCILDYGSGNVRSVFNLVALLSQNVKVSNEAAVLSDATHIILPGVGAFGASMGKILKRIPIDILEKEVRQVGKPFLGICVGMQVLAGCGFEFGENRGFDWIHGEVRRLDSGSLPLPHVGWNDIRPVLPCPLFDGLDQNLDFYFVHSFVFKSSNKGNILAETEYGETFPSVIGQNNIYGVQFHPEKSQKAGIRLMRNFLAQTS